MAGSDHLTDEDRRKHLEFIQAAITRMSTASSNAKSWLLPVVTAAYGYSLAQHDGSVALLGIGAVLLFMFLDANYLRQEKRFRSLYKSVARGDKEISAFSLNPDELPSDLPAKDKGDWTSGVPKWVNGPIPGPSVWCSWSILPFYVVLLIGGIIILLRVF